LTVDTSIYWHSQYRFYLGRKRPISGHMPLVEFSARRQ